MESMDKIYDDYCHHYKKGGGISLWKALIFIVIGVIVLSFLGYKIYQSIQLDRKRKKNEAL